ncbi:erg26, C-3 sterol dehydrogenase [Scheffersomyces spartinae]|uniref:Sterol-4-alpha-carboxylate 3-dehydrogenase ERG26, decarboxylating n=1 Tax=Scheffersomyces spartinae TaxID=45513 RepID=A0A9P7V5D3_9ASCO|nr:erg26, C-3 sterol dehydrogenase [Scheffersomyces spartinae]KAG7191555.1 erg26, C-3 sterol dehydrogenase [Scheffersomyces spartinae]
MSSSVLLIGGAGFLGLHLIEQFHRHCPKTEIHVFDVRPIPEKISSYFTFNQADIKFHQGDLTSAEDVRNAILESKCDAIVHLASPMHGLPQEIYEKVNVQGTRNLLEVAAKETGVKALIYTSSAGVIFNGQDVINADELWPFPKVHMDGYNETKAEAETMVVDANSDDLATICLRPAGIFGPGDRQLVPGLRAAAKLGQSKFQLGDNNNLFDWTYVGNVADAHVLAFQKILNPETRDLVAGEVFFITNDAPTYFWTLARTVWKADGHIDKYNIVLKKPVALVAGYLSQFFSKLLDKEPGLTPFRVKVVCAVRYHDISKAKSMLGYKPEVDLETGIKYTLDWMNES